MYLASLIVVLTLIAFTYGSLCYAELQFNPLKWTKDGRISCVLMTFLSIALPTFACFLEISAYNRTQERKSSF